MPALDGWAVPALALFVAIIAIGARQLVFFPLFYALGVDQRSAQVTSLRLSQISEFALVIAFLGLEMGHISGELSSVIILAFVFIVSILYCRFWKFLKLCHDPSPLNSNSTIRDFTISLISFPLA